MEFYIDTTGSQESSRVEKSTNEQNSKEPILDKRLPFTFDDPPVESIKTKVDKKSDLDECLDEFYANMGWKRTVVTTSEKPTVPKPKFGPVSTFGLDKIDVEEVMGKSVLKPGFDRLKHIPEYDPSERKLKKERRLERSKTKGKKWFNLPATEMTEEVKKDLQVLQMRSALDPKHFYKKNDLAVLPKYFQIGKVVDSPIDFYSGRMTNKERKSNLVEELLADAEFSKYNKKKYKEIMEQKSKTHFKRYRKDKKQKPKNK